MAGKNRKDEDCSQYLISDPRTRQILFVIGIIVGLIGVSSGLAAVLLQ